MKLYYFPLSTYSNKVLLALYEKGIDFEPVMTDLRDDEARSAYREIYPLGKVPLLVLDDDHRIPESSIIVEYLDTTYDNPPKLIPEDPVASRQTRFHDRMIDLYLNESVATLIFEGWKPEHERNTEAMEKARFRAGVIYGFMNQRLAEHSWLMDDFSLADCSAAPPLGYARDVLPFDEYENIVAYWERVQSRSSWQRVQEEMAPYQEWIREQAAAPNR